MSVRSVSSSRVSCLSSHSPDLLLRTSGTGLAGAVQRANAEAVCHAKAAGKRPIIRETPPEGEVKGKTQGARDFSSYLSRSLCVNNHFSVIAACFCIVCACLPFVYNFLNLTSGIGDCVIAHKVGRQHQANLQQMRELQRRKMDEPRPATVPAMYVAQAVHVQQYFDRAAHHGEMAKGTVPIYLSFIVACSPSLQTDCIVSFLLASAADVRRDRAKRAEKTLRQPDDRTQVLHPFHISSPLHERILDHFDLRSYEQLLP